VFLEGYECLLIINDYRTKVFLNTAYEITCVGEKEATDLYLYNMSA